MNNPRGSKWGVTQAQSGAEVAGAPMEKGQDVVGNGGQEVQQQHLHALKRVWCLGSRFVIR